MVQLVQSGESIEGLHTDGEAKKTTFGRPQFVGDCRFHRCVLDRGASLELTRILPEDEFVDAGSHRALGDIVAGDKVRVLSQQLLECDSNNPTANTGRHQTQPVRTRSHTIASVAIRYNTVPERLLDNSQLTAIA